MIIAKKATIQPNRITARASAVTPIGSGSAPAISVDSALSTTSRNPVQNRVITAAVNDLSGRVASVESQALSGAPTPVATVAEMTDQTIVYLYTGNESGYISGNWYYWDGSAWQSGGTYGGLANGSVTGKKLSASIRTALKQIFQHVAYTDAEGQTYYNALVEALNGDAVVVSISAVYTQSGTVYDTANLDDLKADLVVTANYSDGTSEAITGYTLSGSLDAGTSTITVAYDGMTATFNVTVTATLHPMVQGTHTFSDGSTITVSKNHVSIYIGANHTSSSGVGAYFNLSDITENSTDITSQSSNVDNKASKFAIPNGATVTYSMKNIVASAGLSVPNLASWSTRVANGTGAIQTGISSGNVDISASPIADISHTITMTAAKNLGCLFNYIAQPTYGGTLEYDIEFTVNGERYV